MKIVVLDGYALNPGDLDWTVFHSLGEIIIYDRTAPDLIVERCRDAEVIFTNKVKLDAAIMDQLPDLKFINVTATGFDNIDVVAASSRDITVCNVPDYSSDSVAQHTFAFILELCNKVGQHHESVREGAWARSPDFAYALSPLVELRGKTIGLLGMGNIAWRTAEIAKAFGMNVVYWSRSRKELAPGLYVTLDELLKISDVVSLHIPLSTDTRQFIDAAKLLQMKRSAVLINTARGALINEPDLAAALNDGVIAGAGLDVLSQEPPAAEHPLLHAKNCYVTPHNAWMSREARQRIIDIVLSNLEAFLNGERKNVVSGSPV